MERASRRKYHYIYKTTCIITNRFYVGMHSTDNLEDGYIGSGKRLWYSINKHGRDNHICEILEFLPDRSSLKIREKQIINEELLMNKLCMNLALGGEGGISTHYHNLTENQKIEWHSKGGKKSTENIKNKQINDPLYKEYYSLIRTTQLRNSWMNGNRKPTFTNKRHNQETKKKIGDANSIKQKGKNNSQYGKCWITNDIENKKIYKDDLIPNGWKLGRKI